MVLKFMKSSIIIRNETWKLSKFLEKNILTKMLIKLFALYEKNFELIKEKFKTTKWKDGVETRYFLAIAKLIYSNKNIIIYS